MKFAKYVFGAVVALAALALAHIDPALAQDAEAAATPAAPTLNAGDTAWMLTSTALVLMMTIPGLALFYGGMVRKKNVLATVMQSFAITCIVTVVWMVVGYSLAFTDGGSMTGLHRRHVALPVERTWTVEHADGHHPRIGLHVLPDDLRHHHPGADLRRLRRPHEVLRAADLHGPVADLRLLRRSPTGSGAAASSAGLGVLDFAGGTVVHINAGVAGLVCALVLGKRVGYGTENMAPHNLVYAVIGASLLWVGWFGFNAGSAVAADGRAGMAMAVTQIATAAAALAWMFAEWLVAKKPSVLGIISGAVAGLVAITPASGFVDPVGALSIGIGAGVGCFFAATTPQESHRLRRLARCVRRARRRRNRSAPC